MKTPVTAHVTEEQEGRLTRARASMLSIVDEAATCSQISSGKVAIYIRVQCNYTASTNFTRKGCDVFIGQR
jgi:hypothetical protein